MIGALTAALTASLFACAGWLGALAGEALAAGRAPFDDGPATIAPGRIAFAACAACVGLALALHHESPLHLAVLLQVTFALAGAAAADFRCGALPDVLTLGPLGLVVLVGAASLDWAPVLGATAIAIPFAFAALVSRGRAMGWGDVKLAALGGALFGVADATLAFLVAALAAYAVAWRTAELRRPIAFGPYLAASIAASLIVVRII